MVCVNKDVGFYCAARDALFSAVTIPGYERMSNHPLISRYVKGIYNKYPQLPKYVNIWDMNKLLTYYDNMGPNSKLTFKVMQENSSFSHASGSKEETGGNRHFW